jgi:hypothetical protein
MLWIVTVMVIPEGFNNCVDLPKDFEPMSLGNYDDVLKVFQDICLNVDDSDRGWWSIEDKDGYHFEVIVGSESPLTSIGIRSPSLEVIQLLYDKTGWRGIDPSNCSIIPPFVDEY